ncbi:MAG TPA: zinc ribbon domain-containing protein [Blastocatellia bacterium]|nr:zinc ribbon domain-containing protein [Blastocatellia bacterium]
MFCQECGKQIRPTARFCNRCGSPVRQRFNAEPQQAASQPLPAKNESARQADERSVTPKSREASGEGSLIIPISVDELPRSKKTDQRTIFEPSDSSAKRPKSGSADADRKNPGKHTSTAASSPPAHNPAPQSFFTQVMPATVNRQHNRLVVVTALLLLTFAALVVLFYIAAKYA